MTYETDMKQVNLQVLQSVLYNTEKEISKIKVTLQFEKEDEYKKFMAKFAPERESDDEEIAEDSDSDQENWNNDASTILDDEKGFMHDRKKDVDNLNRLDITIILKEFYEEQVLEIQKQTGVRILIVPQKIKYFGYEDEQIENAREKMYELRSQITVTSVHDYAKEIYESKYYKEELLKSGVRLGKVAETYYYWYDKSKYVRDQKNSGQDDKSKKELYTKIAKQVIERVFRKKVHMFIPLLEKYESARRRFNEKYIDAILQTNAKFYKIYLQKELNDDLNSEHQVQLNQSETDIIAHISVREQSEIIKQKIRIFFENLIHFFIRYDLKDKNIVNIDKIENILQEKGILWHRHEDIMVISYPIHSLNRNDSTLNITSPLEKYQQFIDNIRPIFELNTNCSIQYLAQEDEFKSIEQKDNDLFKKINLEHKKQDGIQRITCNFKKPAIYARIIQEIILKERLFKKQKIQNADQSKSIIQPNSTLPLNDTTTIICENQLMNNFNKFDEGKEEGMNYTGQIISEDMKENTILKNYVFFLKDNHGEKKYSQNAEVCDKVSTKLSQLSELSISVQVQTNRKYRLYNVVLPKSLKPKNPLDSSDLITVFAKNEHLKQFEKGDKDFLKVYLLLDSKALKNNDVWLLNVSKSQIKEDNYSYEVRKGTIDIIYFARHMQK